MPAPSTLTGALRDRDSPLRRYLETEFGHTSALQRRFREWSGPLLVSGGSANPALVGSAFDLQVRFVLDPTDVPVITMVAFGGHPGMLAQIEQVAHGAQLAAVADPLDADALGRACWALALTTQVYREGGMRRGSALQRLLDDDRFDAEHLLALIPADAERQLRALLDLARERLVPHLYRPLHLGPEFAASRWCAADADLIAGGLLLELKTRLGARDPRTGERVDRLQATDLYQLLGYLLFDHDDQYRIDRLGLYSARYGTLVDWPLTEALATLAGHPVDLAACRDQVWRIVARQ